MKNNRTLYRIFLIITFLVLNGLVIYGISSIFSYLNTGADRSTMLHLPAKLSSSYRPLVIWSTFENEGRPMEKQTLGEIERDYLKSWFVRNDALSTNNHYGVEDYYTDSARVKLFRVLDFNKENSTAIKTTTIEHHPHLDFYSADGKMITLTDKNVKGFEVFFQDNMAILKKPFERTYKIMMLLEDGFWRIRHIVEIENDSLEEYNSDISSLRNRSKISKIKGINYYPKDSPWDMYGKKFNDSIISSDFGIISDMGLNTVRLFVPYEDFGQADIEYEKIEKLQKVMDLAEAAKLDVILTLFDFYGDYSIPDWTLTHRHAQFIVEKFKDHESLLAWDIKNEPDLDFDSRGKENVLNWLSQMMIELRKWDSKNPITIGWSSPEAAENLSTEIDFVSFHYYRKPADFLTAYKILKKAVPHKEMVLQEYGYSSYDGIWNGYLGSLENQTQYYTQMQETLNSENIPFVFWTLYDFNNVPNSVVGRLPWRKNQQKYFGILDNEGKPKPAYDILKE